MKTAVSDAYRTVVPDRTGRHGPLPPVLLTLTVVTGLVDAFSYLVLGHVFVANMTGNVVFLAFSLGGSSQFSAAASLTALGAFAAGALLGGRIAHAKHEHRGQILFLAVTAEALFVLAALLVASIHDPATGSSRYLVIVLLSVAMGAQNAAARALAVPDLTTTVLTLTITGIAADGRLAGGSDSKVGRRATSALSMFLGAFLGALLALHGHPTTVLIAAGVVLVAAAVGAGGLARSRRSWVTPV
ncbi:MAG: hypothetical protein JWQ26_429 [Modestobacter sp.]|nr:hypothetical protein [Modestobacter sp.]